MPDFRQISRYYARFTSIYSIMLELSQIFNYSFDYARITQDFHNYARHYARKSC